MRKTFVLLNIVICHHALCIAQSVSTDSAVVEQSLKNTIATYYKTIGENSHLYNGSEYVGYNYETNKNPFFESIFMLNGTVAYDGTVYHDVPIAYDTYHDLLITNRYEKNYRIMLVSDKIDSFQLAGHNFIRVVQDSSNQDIISTGFYERLYLGKTVVLAKRKKKYEETISTNGTSSQFTEDDHYFILKKGIFYSVRNRKTALSVFKEDKKEIQKLLHKNKIKFKPNSEYGIVKIAEYHDQLTN